MKYAGLLEDFENIRETQRYAVCKVIDEAQNYIEFLEGKHALLENMISYLNDVSDDAKVTKEQMLEGFAKFLTVNEKG